MSQLADRLAVSQTAMQAGRPADTALDLINRMKPQIAAALGASPALQVDRFMRVALTEFRINPELLASTPESIMAAMLRAAQLGLEIGGPLGQAYLVPFRNQDRGLEAQLILGYRGRIVLARRSGEIAELEARTVHQADLFEFEYGTNQHLRHIQRVDVEPGPENPSIAWYARASFLRGGEQFEVIGRPEVDRRRNRSRAKNSPAWTNDYDAMGNKSAINKLAPYLPMTAQAQEAWQQDEEREFGADQAAAMLAPVAPALQRPPEIQTPPPAQLEPKSEPPPPENLTPAATPAVNVAAGPAASPEDPPPARRTPRQASTTRKVKPEAMERAYATIAQAVRMLSSSGGTREQLQQAAGVDKPWDQLTDDEVVTISQVAEQITTGRAELAEENGNWYLTMPKPQRMTSSGPQVEPGSAGVGTDAPTPAEEGSKDQNFELTGGESRG